MIDDDIMDKKSGVGQMFTDVRDLDENGDEDDEVVAVVDALRDGDGGGDGDGYRYGDGING